MSSGGTWTERGAAPAKRLDELLVERNDVQQADIDKALQIQRTVGGRLGTLLVRTGAISEDLLLRRLAEQQGARYLRSDEELPDSLDVYQFMAGSPIKLDWFLDHTEAREGTRPSPASGPCTPGGAAPSRRSMPARPRARAQLAAGCRAVHSATTAVG